MCYQDECRHLRHRLPLSTARFKSGEINVRESTRGARQGSAIPHQNLMGIHLLWAPLSDLDRVTPTTIPHTFCLVPSGVFANSPSIRTHVAVGVISFNPPTSSPTSLSTMTCIFAKQLPSFTSKNANDPAPATRPVFTHPAIRNV